MNQEYSGPLATRLARKDDLERGWEEAKPSRLADICFGRHLARALATPTTSRMMSASPWTRTAIEAWS